jgi:hypothetical protein
VLPHREQAGTTVPDLSVAEAKHRTDEIQNVQEKFANVLHKRKQDLCVID